MIRFCATIDPKKSRQNSLMFCNASPQAMEPSDKFTPISPPLQCWKPSLLAFLRTEDQTELMFHSPVAFLLWNMMKGFNIKLNAASKRLIAWEMFVCQNQFPDTSEWWESTLNTGSSKILFSTRCEPHYSANDNDNNFDRFTSTCQSPSEGHGRPSWYWSAGSDIVQIF